MKSLILVLLISLSLSAKTKAAEYEEIDVITYVPRVVYSPRYEYRRLPILPTPAPLYRRIYPPARPYYYRPYLFDGPIVRPLIPRRVFFR